MQHTNNRPFILFSLSVLFNISTSTFVLFSSLKYTSLVTVSINIWGEKRRTSENSKVWCNYVFYVNS